MKIWQRAFMLTVVPAATALAALLHQPDFPQPTPHHFTKIDYNGNPLPHWSGPWACVCDQRTGLLWEVKTDSETIHDGLWTYSWYQENDGEFVAASSNPGTPTNGLGRDTFNIGTPNNGDCYFEDERCDTADLIRRTRKEQLCGEQNWRLPTTGELHSLVFTDAKAGQPKIDTAYFPKTKRGDYWTSEQGESLQKVYKHLRRGALAVSFVDGQSITIPHRNAAFVRLVTENSKSCH
ncbi:DUF1566 domain-containing protein [uncultured Microbulbifer sp.]|uniref:Lcl C-terminal domain-containing protein n=1 Tax=uncultured Microbulbifer sp. TaxID=348147 RepID=UPI00262D7C52|nr:DUF1566 domain-containing protein [uncultured Microbulbifer sp.]